MPCFPDPDVGAGFAVPTAAAFDAAETNPGVAGNGTSARNDVRLDRNRGLADGLSWIECGIRPASRANCWSRLSDDGPEEGEPGNDETSNKGRFDDNLAESSGVRSGGAWGRHFVLVLEHPVRIDGSTASQAGPGVMTLSTILECRV